MKNSTNYRLKLKLLALFWAGLLLFLLSPSGLQAQDCNNDTDPPTFPPGANVPDPSGVINFGDLVMTCASTFGGGSGQYVMGLADIKDWSTETVPGFSWTDAVNNTYHGPPGNEWNKTNMGEIFGVAFDKDGNIYATATSLYGPSGRDASNAGAIYKIDQFTGIPTLLIQLPNEIGPMQADDGTLSGNYQNPTALVPTTDYPGLGNISYDIQHDQFFVSNLEDGKIYRMATDGTILSTFDPLTADDGIDGIAPRGERVWGLNSWGSDPSTVQLFYSIWGEDFGTQGEGENTMRSIFLDANGEFITSTDQYEFTNPDFSPFAISNPSFMLPFSSPVSDLIVSDDGLKLITAQRSMKGDTKTGLSFSNQSAHRSRIVEYTRAAVGGAWTQSPIEKFRTGGNVNANNCCTAERANSVGGIDWGYSVVDPVSGGTVGEEDLVWSTADFMTTNAGLWYGIQGIPSSGDVEVNQSTILGYGTVHFKSLFGDVEVLQGFPGQISGCADLTANAEPGCGGATVSYNVQATDDCSDVSISYSHAPGSVFPFGETTVVVTATDVAGNSSTCSFTVTVVDVEGPIITNCGSVTVDSDPGSCSATNVTLPQPTATDCGSSTFTYSNNAPSSFPIGSTTYQWTVTDESGNSSICNATVIVNDASPDDDLDGFTVCQGGHYSKLLCGS